MPGLSSSQAFACANGVAFLENSLALLLLFVVPATILALFKSTTTHLGLINDPLFNSKLTSTKSTPSAKLTIVLLYVDALNVSGE